MKSTQMRTLKKCERCPEYFGMKKDVNISSYLFVFFHVNFFMEK